MNALPPTAAAAFAAVLVASIARAFLGPPADWPRRGAGRALLRATAACYVAGAALVVLGGPTLAGAILIVAGIEAACLGAWLVRGGGGRDDDDGDDADDGDSPPWDWAAFDRARATWRGRPRERV